MLRTLALYVTMSVSAHAATLPDALSCGRTGSAGGLGAGADMTRYTVDVRRFPRATCNDGTPAVFYYAPSTRESDRDKWLVFLQGGGSCSSGQSCAQRWCSVDTNFGMDKMTSSLSKPSIRANGFLSPEARNPFGSWNRVLVFYCSSDQWAGTNRTALSASIGNGTREFDIHFHGSFIVDAVFDTLRYAGRSRITNRVDAAPPATWPDLDNATHLMLAGSSGGGNGVLLNADRVGARLRAGNPDLDFRAIAEATYGGQGETLDFTATTLCAADPSGCRYDTFYQAHAQNLAAVHGTRGDESCLLFHSIVESGTEWRCADNEHVVLHHVTTPFFFRQDLLDSLISGNYVETNFGSRADYARQVERELRSLPIPEDGGASPSGLFVPQCTDHEAFTNDRAVFETRVDGVSYRDAVWNWWSGARPQFVIRAFTGTAEAAPECP